MPPRYTIRQVVGTYRRKAFGTTNDDGSPRRPAYPADAIVAFYGVLELAEEQPRRGHFESERLLRILLEGPSGKGRRFARQVPFLVLQGDLVPAAGGGLDVEGWEILQEGDTTIADRVARFRSRKRADPEYHDPLTGAQRTAAYRLRRRVFERDHWTCRYCAVEDYPKSWLVAEHVIPDGPTTEDNLVTACRGCNKRKGGRTPEEAGMVLLFVTPRDGDVTLPDAVTRDVASNAVTRDVETVTPRTGDVRAPRRARNAVATATRLDGYQARATVAPAPAREGDDLRSVLSWLAAERSVSVPEGAALVELARLVDQHGTTGVITALAAQDPTMKDGRQYVFGVMKSLNPLPRNGAVEPVVDPEAEERKRQADADRRLRQRVERYRNTGIWMDEWGPRPDASPTPQPMTAPADPPADAAAENWFETPEHMEPVPEPAGHGGAT